MALTIFEFALNLASGDRKRAERLLAEPWPGGGGSLPGAARVLGPFPFAFDDVGLENGIAFYTPTVNDILLDAWIEVTEGFDGTTPLADIGSFAGEAFGNYGANFGPLSVVDADSEGTTGLLTNYNNPGSAAGSSLSAINVDLADGTYRRNAPGRFTTSDPLKIVVSQDGTTGGTAVGGTAGAGAVYLVVATPSLT